MSAEGRSRALVGAAAAASILLVVAYLAAGGASYSPAKVRDPCQPRQWRSPDTLQGIAEQFTLSALDGAACELRVSREVLARALATPESRRRFARRYRIDDAKFEAAVRAGVVRAIDDAEDAGVLNPLIAVPLREVAKRLPVDVLIRLIRDARPLFQNAQSFLGGLGELIPGGLGGLIP